MSTFTYGATESHVELNWDFSSATDISFSAFDNSINSTSTDLSGLVLNNWIYVTGAANNDNNGWMMVDGTSTSTKIIISVSTVLVTEAAGASITVQGYEHGDNQSYDLTWPVTVRQPTWEFQRTTTASIGRGRESVYWGRDEYWDISFTEFEEALVPYVTEFLHSVGRGDSFLFDPKEDGNYFAVYMDSTSVGLQRIDTLDYYVLSFRLVRK